MSITRIRPGAKAFIVRDGKILVVKERLNLNGQEKIIYDFPGGGMELGENIHETLHREVWEEVRLKIKIERPVGSWDFVISSDTGDVLLVLLGYQCSLLGSDEIDLTQNPADEHIFETLWVSKEELLSSPEMYETLGRRQVIENVIV